MGGYDDGYRICECFWGRVPGSLVRRLAEICSMDMHDLRVLDAGCGEGKNAVYVASLGASVDAFDVSALAIHNAKTAWGDTDNVQWLTTDARSFVYGVDQYDVVISYGMLHCLASIEEVNKVVVTMQAATKPGGYHVVCTFNDGPQDLSAHTHFNPLLLPHTYYCELYAGWDLLECSDSRIQERHPHNNVLHEHSLTRVLAHKPPCP